VKLIVFDWSFAALDLNYLSDLSVRKLSSQGEPESSKKDLNSSNLVSDISCKKRKISFLIAKNFSMHFLALIELHNIE